MRQWLGLVFVLSLVLAAPARAGGPSSAYYAADTDGIFWFMHISDTHVGCSSSIGEWVSTDPGNFQWVFDEGVGVIQPLFLVNTGDLQNGSANDIPTSGQWQQAWDDYKAIYTAGIAANPNVPYYDIVGNHDEYAASWDCPSLHWYLDNSYRGHLAGAAHFSWTHTTPLGDYFFYGFDATGDCVPAFSAGDGTILDSEYNELTGALDAHGDDQLVFIFAHQGPAQPVNSGRVVDTLVSHGAFYLHGHVHEYKQYLTSNTTGELVTQEVASVAKSATDNLAVGVVDHNAFVYRSTTISDPWPFPIVTAPVDMHLLDGELNPWAYDVCKDRVNPIRALVFAKDAPGPVTVQIGSGAAVNMTNVSGPLWTASVDTSSVAEGQQTVGVTATAGGKTRTDTVTVNFVAGPCTDLQDDAGVPQNDAGVPGDGGGTGDDGGTDDGGAGDGGPPPPPPAKGCGCRVDAGAGPAWLGLLGALGLVLLARARGRRRGR